MIPTSTSITITTTTPTAIPAIAPTPSCPAYSGYSTVIISLSKLMM